ncbi:MAG: terminase large subunit domain-containing protein [Christensenellales bacterium]
MENNEIIRRIKHIDSLLDSRKTDKLSNYNKEKVHEKQLIFHKNKAKVRFVFGGNRSGKTECGAVETVWRARGIHPYRENKPVSAWVVSVSYEVQRDVAQGKILGYLNPGWIEEIVMQSGKKASPEYGIIDYIAVKNVFGSTSIIGFKSLDQGREKFQGTSLDFVWFDEEPDEDIFNECRMRVMDRCGDVFCTMTPLKGLTWVHDKIYLATDDDVWYETMEWADNPYLDKREVEALTKSLGKEELESRRFGKFRAESGLIYPEFDTLHVIPPFPVPKEWYDTISIDPGLNNPLSAHFYAMDYDGVIYVIAEHYEKGKYVDYHADRIKKIAAELNWHTDQKGRLSALIDSAAGQRTLAASKSVAELFYDQGIIVNTRVNKDVWAGIARVKALLGERPPRIYIFENCVNLIRELKGYRWGTGDSPRKYDDHALDELRYYVMSKPAPPKAERVPSVIEADKNRLAKKIGRRLRK